MTPTSDETATSRPRTAQYPLIHGRLIPWDHRRNWLVTTHVELQAA